MCEKQKEKIKGNNNGTSGSENAPESPVFFYLMPVYIYLLLPVYVGKHYIHRGKLHLIDEAAGGIDGTV